jgi:hypothetical protein
MEEGRIERRRTVDERGFEARLIADKVDVGSVFEDERIVLVKGMTP